MLLLVLFSFYFIHQSTYCQGKGIRKFMQRLIAYIDGFNLYFGMKDKGWKQNKSICWICIYAYMKGGI